MSDPIAITPSQPWKRDAPVKVGETFDFVIKWRSSADGVEPKTYRDLSLYTLRCSLREKCSPAAPIVTITSSSGITLSDDDEQATLLFTPAQTALLTAGKAYIGDVRFTSVAAPSTEVRLPLSFEFVAAAATTPAS